MRVCIGTALLFSYLLRYSNLRPTLRGGNRLGASPERLSDLLTVRQSCRSGTSSSSLSLSIPSLFLPQASTPLPRILSSCGCLDTGAPSGRPSRPPGWVGTRPQAPGQGAPELAEAGIGLRRREGDWRKPGLRGGLCSVLGVAMRQTGLRLAEVARRGGEDGAGRRGRRDEELEEADREMSAAAGSRERDSSGPAGSGRVGWRVGSWQGAVADRVCELGGECAGQRPRSWPYRGGDLGAEVLWGR